LLFGYRYRKTILTSTDLRTALTTKNNQGYGIY
jgi:hypothetical protein